MFVCVCAYASLFFFMWCDVMKFGSRRAAYMGGENVVIIMCVYMSVPPSHNYQLSINLEFHLFFLYKYFDSQYHTYASSYKLVEFYFYMYIYWSLLNLWSFFVIYQFTEPKIQIFENIYIPLILPTYILTFSYNI